MTDTTDIKALRTLSMQRVKEIANGDSMLMGERVDLANTAIRFHKELDVALDAFKNAATELFSAQEQLEAERQRADDCNKSAEYSAATNKRVVAANCRLWEEIAALKGVQGSIGFVHESVLLKIKENCGAQAWIHTGDKTDGDIELFTAPQKPVVLPPLPAAIGDFTEASMKAVRRMDIAAIEAAGGIVKDGD
jgi:hypothetical protein